MTDPTPAAPTYHLEDAANPGTPLCRLRLEEAQGEHHLVPPSEANTPDGRHLNCVECHKVLTGGHAHVPPPDEDPQ